MPPAQQPSDQPAEHAQASGRWSPPVDSHVHTEWSWDAPREASMVRSCEQAVAAGLPGVAFTDHLDFTTWTDGDQIGAMDLDPYRYTRMHLLDIGMVRRVREHARDTGVAGVSTSRMHQFRNAPVSHVHSRAVAVVNLEWRFTPHVHQR